MSASNLAYETHPRKLLLHKIFKFLTQMKPDEAYTVHDELVEPRKALSYAVPELLWNPYMADPMAALKGGKKKGGKKKKK